MFDAHGNYTPGIHMIDVNDFQLKFIDNFPDSISRSRIFSDFHMFLNNEKMSEFSTYISKIWLDGSFVTSKENPNDIDGVIVLFPTIENSKELSSVIEDLTDYINHCKNYLGLKIDFYVTIDPKPIDDNYPDFISSLGAEYAGQLRYNAEMMYNYWKGKFTFDRNEHPKGIFEVVSSAINGGGNNE